MRSRALAPLLLVVGIAIGFGAAVLLTGGGAEPPGSSASQVMREEAARRGGVDGASLATPGALPRSISSGETDAPAASDARAVLSRAAESARVAAAPVEEGRGTGSFRGVVRDASGAPVAGAVVLASPVRASRDAYELGVSTSDIGRAWGGHPPIDTYYVAPMTRVLEDRERTRSATTDDEGRFVLEGLPAGRHGLIPFAEGFQGERLEANTGAEVELWLVPIVAFEIDPRLPDGSQPQRAVIELEAEGRRRQYRWSPDEPSLRIPLRVATLRVLAGEVPAIGRREYAGTYTSQQRTIDLDVDGSGPHVFELASTPIVRVSMIGADGRDPMEGAWIRLEGEGEGPLEFERVDATTFALGDVPPGAYSIVAGEIPGVEVLTVPLVVTEGLQERTLELPVPDPDDLLVVRCVDGEGRPIEDVDLWFERRRASGGTELLRTEPSPLGRGEWSVPWSALVVEDGPSFAVELTGRSEALGVQRISLDSKVPSARLEFAMPCRLTVVVEGRREGGLYLRIARSDGDGQLPWDGGITTRGGVNPRVPDGGRVDVGAVQPGRYELSLRSARSEWSSLSIAARTVDLRTGPQVETLTLPPLHDLTVQAPARAIGERLTLSPEEGPGSSRSLRAMVDEDGRAVFSGIPAGEYRLRARSARWMGGEMRVTVPSGIVEFEAAEELGIEIRAITGAAPLGSSGLRPGDIVLGTADRRATDDGFWAWLAPAVTEGPVELRILRGGLERGLTLELPETVPGTYPLAGIQLRTALR